MPEHIITQAVFDSPGRPEDAETPSEPPQHHHRAGGEQLRQQHIHTALVQYPVRQPVNHFSDKLGNIQIRHIHQQHDNPCHIMPFVP